MFDWVLNTPLAGNGRRKKIFKKVKLWKIQGKKLTMY